MRNSALITCLFVEVITLSHVHATDKANTQDHPLLERYPNSVITDFKTLDYNQAKLAIKPFSDSDGRLVADNFINVAGKITYIAYDLPDGLSGYQVFENYLSALSNKATELLYICRKEDACSESSYMNSGDKITDNLSSYTCTREFNLVAKTKIAESQFAYINLCVSQHHVTQVIIEEKAFTKDLISLSANEMAQGLSKQGKVAIYGIHFESNSDIILNTSVAAFEQLASLFAMRAELNLYVVGHTDSQGDEEYNQALSTKRAQAVINKLVQSYGVAKERLQARGVGELVPVSTNRDEEGRQLNRRVELVEM